MKHASERSRREGAKFGVASKRTLVVGSLSVLLLSANPEDRTSSHVAWGGTEPSRWPQHTADKRPTFRAAAESVLLQVSVLDPHGAAVSDLQRHNFAIYEDGVPQEIIFFEHRAPEDAVSTAIALLIDTSSSMKGSELVEARKAAVRFVDGAPSPAEIALVGFDDEACVVEDFTRDRKALAEATGRLDAGGGTALYDGLVKAIDLLENSASQRQLLIVLSDGKDLDSVTRFTDVRERLVSSQVVVYTVGYYSRYERELFLSESKYYKQPPVDGNLNPAWVLTEAARVSGGSAFFPKDAVELEPLFSGIARGLRLQYLLAYTPSSSGGERRFRSIDVRAHRSPDAGPLTVRARRGYVR